MLQIVFPIAPMSSAVRAPSLSEQAEALQGLKLELPLNPQV